MQKISVATALAMLVLLAGCLTTPTTATITPVDKHIAHSVCTVWKDVTYSGKHDTAQTIAEVRANNARRDAYCN